MGASKRDGRLRGGGAESERCAQGATERDRVRVNNREKTGKPLGRLGQCRSLADRGNTSRSRAEVTRSPHTAYVYASVHTYTTHTNTRAAHVQSVRLHAQEPSVDPDRCKDEAHARCAAWHFATKTHARTTRQHHHLMQSSMCASVHTLMNTNMYRPTPPNARTHTHALALSLACSPSPAADTKSPTSLSRARHSNGLLHFPQCVTSALLCVFIMSPLLLFMYPKIIKGSRVTVVALNQVLPCRV